MKTFTVALFLAACFAAAPLFAQSAAGAAAKAEEAAAKVGVRFVIISPDGAQLPSPLFCKQGKAYKEIRIGSRTPSVRVRPEGGEVKFYKENPMPTAGADEVAKAKATDKAKLPPPLFTIPVPGGASKMLCIVVPGKDGAKPQTFFLDEKDFPKKGLHIINFSPNKLRMETSLKPDFSDSKKDVIGVFKREAGISPENSWTFKGEEGQEVAFKLCYLPKDGKSEKDLKMISVSKFVLTSRQSQINVVVKVGGNSERLKVMPIQLMSDRSAAADED